MTYVCGRVPRIQGVIDAAAPNTRVIKHSIVIAGHRTSISLEDAFWNALRKIAHDDDLPLAALVAQIDAARGDANLSSALRVFVLNRALKSR
ncbi:MAG: ribbon-helix-helix domain-containing protein [Methylocystis sp.]